MGKLTFVSKLALAVILCFGLPAAPAIAQQNEPLNIEADDLLEWNQLDGIYTARGNAVAVQGTTRITGDILVATYDPDAENRSISKVTATGAVEFSNETTNAAGAKIIYDIRTDDYSVDGPNARVSGKNGSIKASQSIILTTRDDESQRMIATGNAVYDDADGRRFAGNLIDALFDADGVLLTINAKGNVDVRTTTGSMASGDEATYVASTERATLTGNVKVSDGGNVMQGGKAEVDFKSGNSRLLGDGSGGRVRGTLISN